MSTINQKYVQALPFQIYGSGSSVGDTSITLVAFSDIDGNILTMSDLGTSGFGTMEPNTNQEEQIVFTGVTANANGTFTLTGVSHVLSKYPYTQTSGLNVSHAGGTQFVLSDDVGLLDTFPNKNNAETITQPWTFTTPNFPVMSIPATLPTTDGQLATKKYVDTVAIAGAPDASTTVKGISKLSTAPVSPTNPIAVGDNDTRIPTAGQAAALPGNNTGIAVGSGNKYVTQTGLQANAEAYAADASGSTTTYVATLSPVPASLYTGMRVNIKFQTANAGASTLNLNFLGAKALTKNGAIALDANDIKAAQILELVYDGTQFQIQSFDKMSQADATTLTAGSTSDASALHYHPHPVKVINSSRTHAAGSGTQTISGVGFTPKFISITSSCNPTINGYSSMMTGWFDGSAQGCSGIGTIGDGGGNKIASQQSTSQIIFMSQSDSGGAKTFAAVAGNIGADGFDLVWTLSEYASAGNYLDTVFTIACFG